ncbi:4-diphosphocytidyl-2-C-methyl-D-erythritol kinase [hydrothermal vent metagenome]|uniref:4-(cytidine 5'-diphospho)-2-C-methyl-D-erythritol kinase n=1 Tax=hydrothermal vent metagenome TaxID=652676 RepID=A0A3B0WFR8_9ZZZZ
MSNLPWPAPAKLNLMLHITGRRKDGYHELQTIFQFIDFSDELIFKLRDDEKIIRHCENLNVAEFDVPESEDIIIRAANLLRETFLKNNLSTHKKFAVDIFGVDIYLTKNIPMGAGLGGGSSDAATTLMALNKLWGMHFPIDELAELGLILGADVPVFIRGFAAFAEGVGEKLSPVTLPEKWYFVLLPPVHVSTKKVFNNSDLTRDCSAIKLCDLSRHEWRNVCTPVVSKNYPMVSQAIDIVGKYSKAKMSGTGASVFSRFDTKAQADDVLHKISLNPEIEGWNRFVAKGLNQSPLHHFLECNDLT